MRRLKRVGSLVTSTILACSSLMTIGFTGIAHAASGSDTCTWTGATDSKFSTATNWSGCSSAAPVNGDNLVFDASIITSSKVTNSSWNLNNDITGLQVGSITFSGTSSSGYGYELTGNVLSVSGGISSTGSAYDGAVIDLPITLTADQTVSVPNALITFGTPSDQTPALNLNGHTLTLTGGTNGGCANFINFWGPLTGSGQLVSNFANMIGLANNNQGYSGNFQINDGAVNANGANALGDATGTVTVGSNSKLALGMSGDTTLPQNFVLDGGTLEASNTTYMPSCAGGSNSTVYTATFSGSMNLAADSTYAGNYVNAKVTGTYTPNGHTFTVAPGSVGTLTLPGLSAQSAPVQTNTYSDNQPTQDLNVGNNQTAIIDGTRQNVVLTTGATVKGTGTVLALYAGDGSIVAPGHSPGKLTVLKTLDLEAGSTYQAELKDTTAGDYDQIVVGSASDTTGNDVTLGDSSGSPTLAVSLYTGYNIKAGDTFTIIDNLSQTVVSGTFAGLPEGATFKGPDGSVFKITYKGGDGNDVVLTAMTAPTTPDTGFALMSANPVATLGVTVLAAGAILLTARRLHPATVRAKATARRRR